MDGTAAFTFLGSPSPGVLVEWAAGRIPPALHTSPRSALVISVHGSAALSWVPEAAHPSSEPFQSRAQCFLTHLNHKQFISDSSTAARPQPFLSSPLVWGFQVCFTLHCCHSSRDYIPKCLLWSLRKAFLLNSMITCFRTANFHIFYLF